MHNDQLNIAKSSLEIKNIDIIHLTLEMWKCAPKVFVKTVALLSFEISYAPSVTRLVNVYVMMLGDQFASNATQKVSIAMIPVGNQRVTEDHDAHARSTKIEGARAQGPSRLAYASRYPAAMRAGVYAAARARAAAARRARRGASALRSVSVARSVS